MGENILVESTAHKSVLRLLLDRPPVNAMSLRLYGELLDTLRELDLRSDLKCLLIGSNLPGGFCAGADKRELAALTGEQLSADAWEARESLSRALLATLEKFSVPTIAVMDGYVIGVGLVLASLCDIRIATSRTWFSIPELAVRRLGGASHAYRIFPRGTVSAMYYRGIRVSADEARSVGALNDVSSPEDLWKAALSWASEIADHDRETLRLAKRALGGIWNQPTELADQQERLFSFRLASSDRSLP